MHSHLVRIVSVLPIHLVVSIHLLTFSSAIVAAAETNFRRVEIDATPPANPWIKIVGDLNNDRKPDIVIGGSKGPLVWYENPSWNRRRIADGGYDSVSGAVADIDNDGDPDVVVGGILWYENPGAGRLQREAAWASHRIGTHRTHDVEAVDLDGDRKIDVIVRGQTGFGHNEGHRILIWKQLAPTRWASREIACPNGEGLAVADLNADSKPDLVIGGRWYENPGEIQDGIWTEHIYTANWTFGDCKVAVADLNGDGRLDVVLSPAEYKGGQHKMAWFAAPPDPRRNDWNEHILERSVETVVHALAAADMNGDGRADIITARMHQGDPPQEVAVYLNSGEGRSWTKEIVSRRGSHNIITMDMNADGRTDILGANHGGPYQPVELWQSTRPISSDLE